MTPEAIKRRIKLARNQHDVHVGLLMLNEGLSKPDAIVMAYLDGYGGLAARMVPPDPAPGASDSTQPYDGGHLPAGLGLGPKPAKPEATK